MKGNDDKGEPRSAGESVARRLKEVRKRRNINTASLAAKCAAAGLPTLTQSSIENIESGRRSSVTVDELLTLAYVLDVAPVHLLVSLEDREQYKVTSEYVEAAHVVRDWVRGHYPLDGTDPKLYFSDVPDSEWGQHVDLRRQGRPERREMHAQRRDHIDRLYGDEEDDRG